MRINFIRHGMTEGNMEKRYIGRTDEPLCSEGIRKLLEHEYPECSLLVSSPMRRCTETAAIIYPGAELMLCSDFRECDFGKFENRNYREMCGDEEYQRWIDSNGTLPFPGGESVEDFKNRCIAAFDKITGNTDRNAVVSLVVHGGTIMSVMERYAVPKGNYYDFSVKNAECLITEFDGTKITILEKI